MPAPTVRVRRHREGYVQVRGGRRRYFKRYGDDRTIDNRTGREAQGTLALEHAASEVLHLKLYTHLSEFYGAPQWLGALSAMLGSQKAHEFNIEFFDNRAVPAYAVVVKGGRLSADSRNYIETFFREHLKGQHHRTVLLEALPGVAGQTVDVTLEPLAVEVRDASFRLFKLDNATEILVAHKMPPYRVGWAILGSLGGATAAEMTQIYKESVIKPRQTRLEAVLNRLFRDVLGVKDWELRFQEIDVRDEVRDMELAERRVKLGAWSPNDVAVHLGKEPVPGGDERIIWINPAAPVRVADLPALGARASGGGNGAGDGVSAEDQRLLESLGLKRAQPVTLRARERLVKRFQAVVTRLLAAKAARFLAGLEERRLVAAVQAVRAQGVPAAEAVAEKARRPLSPTQRAILEGLFADMPEAFSVDDLLEATVQHMRDVANWAGTAAYSTLGLSVSFNLKNPAMIETFRRIAGEHVQQITETARQDLQELLIEKFFEEGKNPLEVARAIRRDLAGEIEETYRHRAETIARTETGMAQTVTQDEVFRRAGVQTYTWITTRDDKVRPSHQALDGVTIRVGERFPNGLRFPLDPEGPPEEVIACRCDALPGFEADVDLDPDDVWTGD
jgi:PBSX family phage portal protein